MTNLCRARRQGSIWQGSSPPGVRVSRIALRSDGERPEFADEVTMIKAIEGARTVTSRFQIDLKLKLFFNPQSAIRNHSAIVNFPSIQTSPSA
jgi:hypothetical protein